MITMEYNAADDRQENPWIGAPLLDNREGFNK